MPAIFIAALLLVSAGHGCTNEFDAEIVLVRQLKGATPSQDGRIQPDQFDCLWIAYCIEASGSKGGCTGKSDDEIKDEFQFVRLENDEREGPGPDILNALPPYDDITLFIAATYRLEDGSGRELVKARVTHVNLSKIPKKGGKRELVVDLLPCSAPEECWERCPGP